jgi:hypothetical protein
MSSTPPQVGPWGHADDDDDDDDDDDYPWDVRSDYDDTDGSWDAPGAPPNVNLVVGKEHAPTGTGTEREGDATGAPPDVSLLVGKEHAPTGTGTEREAVVEALEQLRDPDNTQGVVWIPDYQERFSGLGMTLRELLENHPDKFTVHHDAWPVSLVYREDTFHVDHVSLVYREVHSNSNSSWCTISMAPSRPGKVGSLVGKEHAPTGTGTEREAHYPTAYAMKGKQ